ncbi:hypothetical protein D3C72_1144790 [compost metagenome]
MEPTSGPMAELCRRPASFTAASIDALERRPVFCRRRRVTCIVSLVRASTYSLTSAVGLPSLPTTL